MGKNTFLLFSKFKGKKKEFINRFKERIQKSIRIEKSKNANLSQAYQEKYIYMTEKIELQKSRYEIYPKPLKKKKKCDRED